jgi:UDP:flavonoid glycosyltransferase YjiC (YdhE family)
MALGSYGDVLPCVVLGRALTEAGHEVAVTTFEGFRQLVEGNDLSFYPVPGDAASILAGGGGLALSEAGQNVVRMVWGLRRSFVRLAGEFAEAFSQPELRQADLIINQLPGGLYGYDLAEAAGVPWLQVAVMPLTRTRAFPMLAFPAGLAWLPGYNTNSYRLAEQIVWQLYRKSVNRWRQVRLGLGKLPWAGFMGRFHQERVPVLNGFSRHMVARPPDWGEHVTVTGYWFHDEGSWQPPDALRNFLSAGPAPVFAGFGSMPLRHRERTLRLMVEGIRLSGQRGVLQGAWSGADRQELPEQIHLLDYAPYNWLFPKMAALIHHGGSGTTGHGVRSGVPSIITPFLFDQFFWGRRIEQLGVGPEPIPFKRLSAKRLATAIGTALNDGEMRKRAAALGGKIRREQGLETAVDLINEMINR